MEITQVFKSSTVADCTLIDLPKYTTTAGHITAINNQQDIPFNIERVYYLYDIPSGETRGGHAHYDLHQIIVAAMGSFDVVLYDGKHTKVVTLNRPDKGLLVVPGIWRELENFSAGGILLVLASTNYSAADYIRKEDEFTKLKQ